jgi:hypothetical protein
MDRFWRKVEVRGLDECWLWSAGCFPTGYGAFGTSGNPKLSSRSHRTAWILTHGPIPSGLDVCHTCDTPKCCNPTHLFLGTDQDNANDKVSKGRQARLKGEAHPSSKLTDSEVLEIFLAKDKQQEMARKYGIKQPQVSQIKSGKAWRHLTQVNK